MHKDDFLRQFFFYHEFLTTHYVIAMCMYVRF
jgi:hypothetical protein